MTLAEVAALQNAEGTMPAKPWTAFTLAVYSGLRAGELWGLRWQDVFDLENAAHAHLIIARSYEKPPKGNRSRRVPLLPPARAALRKWRRHGDVTCATGLVFPRVLGGAHGSQTKDAIRMRARRGTPLRIEMHTKGYDADWAKHYRAQLGVRPQVRLHDLRHTFGSYALSGEWGRPWPLEELQRVMGHASRTTTERYAKLTDLALQRGVVEAIAMWR